MKLSVCGGEINEIIRVSEDRKRFAAIPMFGKADDFIASKRASEPLHVVFHEHLHGSAIDRTSAFDSHVGTARNRHVRAEQGSTNGRIGASTNRCLPGLSVSTFLQFASHLLLGFQDSWSPIRFLYTSRAG